MGQEFDYENMLGLAQSSILLLPIILVPLLIFYNSKSIDRARKRRWLPFYLIWTFLPYLGLWLIAYGQDTRQIDIGYHSGLMYLCFAVFSPYLLWAVQAWREN